MNESKKRLEIQGNNLTSEDRREIGQFVNSEIAVASEGEVFHTIQSEIPQALITIDDEELERRRQQLSEKPFISANNLREATSGINEQSEFAWVPVDQIVGAWGARENGWGSEISSRKGRVEQLTRNILHSREKPEALEEIFHVNKKNERIQVTSIPGPAGSIYLVDDGTHRVSASMLAGLTKIPCEVKTVNYPRRVDTTDELKMFEWQRLIKAGLVKGIIEEKTGQSGTIIYEMTVEEEVLPWITSEQKDLIKISQLYEQLYPGSLDNLKIPKDALLDGVANNFYLAGRWEEWEQNHSSEK